MTASMYLNGRVISMLGLCEAELGCVVVWLVIV